MRSSPNVTISTRPFKSVLIAQGWDTIKETYNLALTDYTKNDLENAKAEIQEKNTGKGKRQGFTIIFGGEEFQLDPFGASGTPYVLRNDLFTIDIRNMGEWDVSVRYSSAVLWQYSYKKAQEMVLKILLAEMRPICMEGETIDAWQRISEAHYALDFYSTDLSNEFGFNFPEQFVCHSSTKPKTDFEIKGYIMGSSVRCQTFTVGSKKSLQIQLYDKITEINQASGKMWMYKIWEREGFHPSEEQKQDVWRLEIRMSKGYFRGQGGREIKTPKEMLDNLDFLLSEALYTRRLVDINETDENKRRWDIHPFWGHALEVVGACNEMLPIGKQVEQGGDEIMEKIKQDLKSLMRRRGSIKEGCYDHEDTSAFFNSIMAEIEKDEDHETKMELYNERYKYVNCAR